MTATLELAWWIAVKAEPLTCAVLFWLDAPEPVATCWEVDELPWLLPPTPLPMTLATLAFDPSFAKEPLSAEATPPKRATARGERRQRRRRGRYGCLPCLNPPENRSGTCSRQLADRLGRSVW